MSVLIKGMEMPTSCWDCYFQDCGNCRLNAHKVVDKCIIEDRIDNDCPLAPVPPHGRLIDAGALTYLMGMDEHFSPLEAMYLMELIADAPTIIPKSGGTEDE